MKFWKQLGMFSSQIIVRCYHRSAGRCLSLLQESRLGLSLSCLTSSHTTNNAILHTWLIMQHLKHLAHFTIFLVAAVKKKTKPFFSFAAWTFWRSVLSCICVRLRGRCQWKEPGGSLLPSKAGGLHKFSCLWHAGNLAISHSGTTFCCLCTTGATFQLGELTSCLQ